MPTEGERITTLEVKLDNLRDDVHELSAESVRARSRLHDLEGLAATLVSQEKQRNRDTRQNQERTHRRLELLTIVLLLTSVLDPFLYHAVIGG